MAYSAVPPHCRSGPWATVLRRLCREPVLVSHDLLLCLTNQTTNHGFLHHEAPRESSPPTTSESQCREAVPSAGSNCSTTGNSSRKMSPELGLLSMTTPGSVMGRGRQGQVHHKPGEQARIWGAPTTGGPGGAACGASLGLQPSWSCHPALSLPAPLPATALPGRRACAPTARPPSRDQPKETRAREEAGASSGSRSGQLDRALRSPGDQCSPGGRARFPGRALP